VVLVPNLTRRQLLRLALAGTVTLTTSAVAANGPLAEAALAVARRPTVVLGVRTGPLIAGGPQTAIPVLVQSLDLATGRVQSLAVAQLLQDGVTPVMRVNETITGCTALADGTVVLAITPLPGSKHAAEPTRLAFLTQSSSTVVAVAGLRPQDQLQHIVSTTGGILLGLVGKRNGTPPTRLVRVDSQTGATTDDPIRLPANMRFAMLAHCSDGQLFTTTVDRDGETSLVHLDTGRTVALKIGGKVWNNGLASLLCSADNELLALGAPRYKTPNAVYAVDRGSGALTWVRDFDVARLTVT
jgi:hypothetical protein